jgi:ABC-type sugar transport system ATPase subunit
MGAGRTELIRCLFGLDKYERGQIVIGGQEVAINSPAEALRLGLGLVSEDRQITGLVPCLSLGINVTLSHLDQCSRGGVIARDQERRLVDRAVRELRIKSAGAEQRAGDLSGGNQQKVVLAKALLGAPDILLLDEPTRGIDVGTKAEIYELMRGLAGAGKAIVMASSELEEVMGMSDRILVLSGGRVAGELRGDEVSPEAIMRYAMVN